MPAPLAMAAAAGLPIIMGLIGEAMASGNAEEAERLRKQAIAQFNIDLPDLETIQAQSINSQAAQAQGSAEGKSSRLEALRGLQARAQEGYTAEDRAAIGETLSEVDQQARGRSEAIMRGVDPTSGAALALRAGNAQNATQVANRRGLDIAAGSRAAQLQALQAQGQLAGQVDDSEFGQAYKRGGAGDAVAQFNERNRLGATQQNNANAMAQANQQMDLASKKAGALGGAVSAEEQEAERKRRMMQGVGSGLSTAVGGAK